MKKLNILEPSIVNFGIIVKNAEDFTRPMILDDDGNYLGEISMISGVKEEFGLGNSEGITIARSKDKKKLTSKEYSVIDKEGRLIGNVRKKSIFNPNFIMEKNGENILFGEISNKNIIVKDKLNHIIATIEIGRKEGIKDSIFKKNFYMNLRIQNSNFDRVTLMGFFLSIYHNKVRWGGVQWGPGEGG